MFPAIAPTYDFLTRWLTFTWADGWRRAAVHEARLRTGAQALDLATGTGEMALLLSLAAGPLGRVVGVDVSEAMLAEAREKIRGRSAPDSTGTRGISPAPGMAPIEFTRLDGESLPFEDGTFDAATLSLALRYFDVPTVLAEMRRVLKPGGRAVIVEFGEPESTVMRAGYHAYAHWMMPALGAAISRRRDVWRLLRFLPNSIHHHHTPEELVALFRQAGFEEAACRRLTLGIGLVFSGTAP
jgi:demethylmenaquinone methyltransferase/2-methoxy-6-polyprenyl-1,4-benzoquinol methylase